MKRLFILLLSAVAFTACKKEPVGDNGIIIEPPPVKHISGDTLKTGERLGLAIGQPGASLYTKIQQLKASGQISYMYVVANVFSNLEAQANKISLYQSLYLDETQGTGTGIQIYFAANKVESIFTNDGLILSKWPAGVAANATINVGDARDGIYQKLQSIKQTAYAYKLQRISLFSKDLDTVYEAGMDASPQWYFAVKISEKRWEHIQLIFTNGVLTSIYDNVYE